MYGLALSTAPSVLFADEVVFKSSQIKEEETQLAQIIAVRDSIEPPFEYSLGVGYRKDNLKWSVAMGGVNTASELSWDETVIAQIRVSARANLGNDWFVRGLYITGAVKSGTNRDSDYAGSDRTQEYSRSDSKTGGSVGDVSLGLGRRLHLFGQEYGGRFYLSPLAGLSIHKQALTMYEGRRTIPFSASLTGLDNSYDAQWSGAWIGADALWEIGRNVSLNATAEYHRVDYLAQANWNLRSDFAHPVSFEHDAKGHGGVFSIGISYRFSRNLLLNSLLDYQRWHTNAGSDRTFFSYGTTGYNTLNSVNWDSTSISFGAVYQF